jgi:hypothetical protein
MATSRYQQFLFDPVKGFKYHKITTFLTQIKKKAIAKVSLNQGDLQYIAFINRQKFYIL